MKRSFLYFIVILFAFTTFSFIWHLHQQKAKAAEIQLLPKFAPNFQKQLQNFEAFLAIQGLPLSSKYSDVLSVKVVYDIRSKTLFFLNSKRYNYHFEFCEDVLHFDGDLEKFNRHNYSDGSLQSYLLANLNYYPNIKKYALEFTGSTLYESESIKELYKAVIKNSYLKDSLNILISTNHLIGIQTSGELNLSIIFPAEIYQNQQTQILNQGHTLGILKWVDDIDKDYKMVYPNDIIVIKGTPTHVPICAGIITNSFQTPLSHIQVLCHNRHLPAVVDKNIWQKTYLQAMQGKMVKFTVDEDTVMFEEISKATYDEYLKDKEPFRTVKLQADLSVTELLSGKLLDLKRRNSVGNKAGGVGQLQKLAIKYPGLFEVPEGAFAIPFYYYQQHIQQHLVQTEIKKLLTNALYKQQPDILMKQLKTIREAIKTQKLDANLLALVEEQIRRNEAGNSYRFRSSCNAEDLEGFSGAGLYTSKTGISQNKEKSIEKAIKDVWASTWNLEAYIEREFHHIDQNTVMMGVLCHRNFPDEKFNGVAITRNLYRPGFFGFTVNVQAGEVSVVDAADSITCEQFVCMNSGIIIPNSTDISADYLTYSSLSPKAPLLSNKQITTLYKALDQIKEYFYWAVDMGFEKDTYEQFALDLEFKFDKNDKLYIKQVRSYD